jgi:hypothetical protein
MDSSDKMVVTIVGMFFVFILGLGAMVNIDEYNKREFQLNSIALTEDPVVLALILGKSH